MKLMKTINRIGLAVVMAATAMTAAAQATQAVAPAAPRAFHQDGVKGMEDVLILNPISRLILAGAPDSVLFAHARSMLIGDFLNAQNGNMQVDKNTGTKKIGVLEEDLTMTPFRLKEKDFFTVSKNGQRMPPAHFECMPALKAVPQDDPNQRSWSDEECNPGFGYSSVKRNAGVVEASTNHIVRVIQKIKADVKRATSFGVVIHLGDGSRFGDKSYTGNMAGRNITETEFGTGINFNKFSSSTRTLEDNLQHQYGLSVLADDATWYKCMEFNFGGQSSESSQFKSTLVKDSDVTAPCLKFNGMAGIRIPKALLVRDLKQFDPVKQDLAIVMIVSNPRKITTQRTEKGNAMKLVEVTPIGWHVIDGKTASTVTSKKIDVNQPGVFLRQSPIECVKTYVGTWGERGLLSKNVKETEKAFEICRNDLVQAKMKQKGITAELASAEIAKEESLK